MSKESWSCCECAASFARARFKLPFDKGSRRRIYLLRHAEAAYESLGPSGDPRLVPLTPHGREQAAGMAKLLADTAFDRAVCSGLPRTRETAEIVRALGAHHVAQPAHVDVLGQRRPTGIHHTRVGSHLVTFGVEVVLDARDSPETELVGSDHPIV